MTEPVSTPFQGLRILDTTHVLAGPCASYQLGLMGAEVIKIENPAEPDQSRFQGTDPDLVRLGLGSAFLAQGVGKRTLALDLKSDAGRNALRRLVETADVFVENYCPGAFDALGLGPDTLCALNPKLIYCSISAYGATGPRREETGYDNVIQAFSGIMDLTGFGDGRALKCGAQVVDYATGLTAAFAITAALFQRSRTGKGQHVDVSMLDVAMTLLTAHGTDFLQSGRHPRAHGNWFAFATLGMYRARDADMMIAASNLRQQKRLWVALGREDLVKSDNFSRIEAVESERAILADILATRSADAWEQFFRQHRVPAARIRKLAEALDDPQTQARRQVMQLSDPSGRLDGLRVIGAAFRLSGATPVVPAAPRPVGADSAAILRELGLADSEIEALCVAALLPVGDPT